MLIWSFRRERRSGTIETWIASLVALMAVTPTVAATSDGFDCHFTKICRGETCEALDNAPMRLRLLGLGDGSNPVAITLADARLLQGPSLEEGKDFSILFGDYEPGSHSTVQAIGTWINSADDPRREVIISFGEAVQLAVTPADVDNAVLTKEGRGLTAFLLGASRTIGTCEVVNLGR